MRELSHRVAPRPLDVLLRSLPGSLRTLLPAPAAGADPAPSADLDLGDRDPRRRDLSAKRQYLRFIRIGILLDIEIGEVGDEESIVFSRKAELTS